jgi:RNA polymerase sigma-70 factor (ECF subfamily)
MDDCDIVELYWQRNEEALEATRLQYGPYCYGIAYHILYCHEDAMECENDTYLAAWNAMPPNKPTLLSAFLGKITRRISLDKWKYHHAQKRGGYEVNLSLDELSECIPDHSGIEHQIEMKELAMLIDAFLRKQPVIQRQVFLCRYWYIESIDTIAKRFSFTQSKVKSMLHNTRQKLRTYLEEREVYL